MYSERVILEKLARFKKKYGWVPTEHSVEDVEKINRHIESLAVKDSHGDLVWDDSTFSPQLKRWIQNERAMCTLNFEYYLTRYHFISAENRIFRFKFRGGQRVLFNVIQDLEEKGFSIQIQLLKARQGGFSTFVEALMTHRALFVPGVKCAVGSANDQKTTVMMGMMYTALEYLPWWLPPKQTKDKRSGAALLEFAHVGSSIVIQSGSMRGGIGQGTTPTAIHLSEVCDYTNPIVQIEEGLFRGVHAGPEILMILESTGNGNTDWWARQWRKNKDRYPQGLSRICPVFIPWFMTPELYPKKEWLNEAPIPKDWEPNEETRATVKKCELYAKTAPHLQLVLGKNWKMPIEQQWFWEFNYEDAKAQNTVKSWTRQMPCDDYDALIGENDPIFDPNITSGFEEKRSKEIDIYGIIGDGIAEKHDPLREDVDYKKERILIPWKTPHEIRLEWVLMPLRFDSEAETYNPLKKLHIYEHPQKKCKYSIAVDTGFGKGQDRTALSVNRCGMDAVPDVQVAEFAADDIDNVECYAWVAAIAAYYGQYMDDGQQVKIIIEQRRKYGDSCYHALKLHGFRNHHHFRDYDKKTLRPVPHINAREGWYTNEWSRPLLLGTFKDAVENGWYVINSRFTLHEIETLEQVVSGSGKIKQDHREGEHDDRIFAAALAYFTFHDNDLMAERSKKRYNADKEEGWDIDYSPWTLKVQNPDSERFFSQFVED